MEVVKIRLQAQMHSLADPQEIPQYRNAGHAVYKIIREEGFKALYRGVTLTALRQATNQGGVGSTMTFWTFWITHAHGSPGVNFTAYQELKKLAAKLQHDIEQLPSYQHMLIGLISGAMGPFSNAPIDTIKTRKEPNSSPPTLVLTLSAPRRFAEVASHTRPDRVPKDIRNLPRYVAPRRLPSVLQGYHPSRSPRRSRTSHRIRRVRASEQAHGEIAELAGRGILRVNRLMGHFSQFISQVNLLLTPR